MEERERLRISRYFRKVMKLVAKEVLTKKMVTKDDLYTLFETHSAARKITTLPDYIKYKFTKKSHPKITLECEFMSLKMPLKLSLKGSFRIVASKKNRNKLVAKKFYMQECNSD
ncbi:MULTISPECIES: hypothetical protein [unclassified Polaribacter]|uniref:hypothetical protein n=1 Tax=unclassified Polaribacter TaxID=196858 RepID=UPI0011BD899A|nr:MULTISPECIES: hypothetical protein [unclassified Polaribacter]TXD54132.1 hypothetical protein ES043_01145 [Polaribacter sp. IC063]TXD62397.1 hypothetical protein ES044_01355 [Polaribacter sp. IC066]